MDNYNYIKKLLKLFLKFKYGGDLIFKVFILRYMDKLI